MTRIAIVSAARTPIGKYGGALSSQTAVQLGTVSAKAALYRARVSPEEINEVIFGNVLQAGQGQNPARQIAIGTNVPYHTGAMTINKVCGSGMKAVMLAELELRAGDKDIILAGGIESMSNAPYYLKGARFGYRMGNGDLIDGMIHDGLWDVYEDFHMGNTGEIVAEKHGLTREDIDLFSVRSNELAVKATETGAFKEEIVPVEVKLKRDMVSIDKDEGPRPGTTMESLAKLKPVFRKDGIVTAGNASQLSDGASALVLMKEELAKERGIPVLATIADHLSHGVEPKYIMEAPIPGCKMLLERNNLAVADIDLWEHNEAFASASVALQRELGIDDGKFNVNGGAVALGHPIGCTGARIITTLIYSMKARGDRRGVATLCIGGGNSTSILVEM